MRQFKEWSIPNSHTYKKYLWRFQRPHPTKSVVEKLHQHRCRSRARHRMYLDLRPAHGRVYANENHCQIKWSVWMALADQRKRYPRSCALDLHDQRLERYTLPSDLQWILARKIFLNAKATALVPYGFSTLCTSCPSCLGIFSLITCEPSFPMR